MDYQETISYIHATPKFSRILGNDLLRRLLGHLGNPQNALRFIHVAGTNGKGSVCAMTAEILRLAGYKTGLFTSPYIQRFNERIAVDGQPIPDDALARIATQVRRTMEEHDAFVSEFALDLAIGLVYFQESGCDVVVLETGMGGRLDATNVIVQSLVSAIVSISLDHTQYLGDTIEKIALEKCGIIKEGGCVVSYPRREPSVEELIRDTCRSRNARYIPCAVPEPAEDGFIYRGIRYPLGLKGAFQPYNGAVVLEIVAELRRRGWELSEAAVNGGLSGVKWPARFERLGDRLILDGGHNPEGAKALAASLNALKRPVHLVIAMMEDKERREAVSYLAGAAQAVTATRVDMPRCCSPSKLAALFQERGISCSCVDEPVAAVNAALKETEGTDGIVCVCGSLYLAGVVRDAFFSGEIAVKITSKRKAAAAPSVQNHIFFAMGL